MSGPSCRCVLTPLSPPAVVVDELERAYQAGRRDGAKKPVRLLAEACDVIRALLGCKGWGVTFGDHQRAREFLGRVERGR